LAKHAKQELFSKSGAFPMTGGANFLETLAQSPQAEQMAQRFAGQAMNFAQTPQGQQMLGQALGQAQGLAGQALAGGPGSFLSALPRAQGPTLESFLASQGIPQIPVTVKKVPGDFLGNGARWWVKAAASPYLGTLVKLTFFFMFFLSFLESTPLFGSVISATLDVILAGGRILVKSLQKGLPALMGLLPLPYTQLSGVALVSVVGMFAWSILAAISFSRQDFTSAIDSMLRIIPIPVGDAMADAFLDANRTIDQLNDKRIKLTDDIWNGILLIRQFLDGIGQYVSSTASGAFQRVQSGTDKLLDAIQGIRANPPPPFVPGTSPFQESTVPTAVPVPEPVPTAVPVPEPPQQQWVPLGPQEPAQTPLPKLPPELPEPAPVPEPVPVAPPAPVPEPAPPAPVPEPVPTFEAGPPPAPTFEAGPPPAQSALERLRSGQSVNRAIDVGRGLRGGKSLSGKRRTRRKWTHPLYERFYGLGSR
jgi:hypothetical protein